MTMTSDEAAGAVKALRDWFVSQEITPSDGIAVMLVLIALAEKNQDPRAHKIGSEKLVELIREALNCR